MKSQLLELDKERGELLSDNQRMAEMLATSEGDSAQVTQVIERLTEERRSLLRQCQQLRDNGTTSYLGSGLGRFIPLSSL